MSNGPKTLFGPKSKWAIVTLVSVMLIIYLAHAYVIRPHDLEKVIGVRSQDVSYITLYANWVEDPEIGMLSESYTIHDETIIDEVLVTLSGYTVRKQFAKQTHVYSSSRPRFYLAVFLKPNAHQNLTLIVIPSDVRFITVDNITYLVDGVGIDTSLFSHLLSQGKITP